MPEQHLRHFAGAPEHQLEALLCRQGAEIGQLESQLALIVSLRKHQDAVVIDLTRHGAPALDRSLARGGRLAQVHA
jgi:hypothetical protein